MKQEFKAGDKVIVTRKATQEELGSVDWVIGMDNYIGKECTIIRIVRHDSAPDRAELVFEGCYTSWFFPLSVLQKVDTVVVDGIEIALTEEQIRYVKKQKRRNSRFSTWEEAYDIVRPRYWPTTSGRIEEGNEGCSNTGHIDVPTKEQAKSILALCKLLTIAEALHKLCGGQEVYIIYKDFYAEELIVQLAIGDTYSPLYFTTKENAEYVIETFPELLHEFLA